MAQFNNAMSPTICAAQHQECAHCYEPLYAMPVVTLCESSGKRSCAHYLHAECASNHQDKTCPVCQKQYEHLGAVPNPLDNPKQWFAVIDADGDKQLSYDEIIDGLKAQLSLDWKKIESDADLLWGKWDPDGNLMINEKEFLDTESGVVAYLRDQYPKNVHYSPPPDIKYDKGAWFDYWDEDHSGLLDKGEVGRALIKTFKVMNINRSTVAATLDIIWPIFDTDGSGQIDRSEFIAPDNLADTVIAQLLADAR